MAEVLIRRRSERYFLIALFALIGAAIGFLLFLTQSSPVDPVMMGVIESTLPGSQPEATLTVTFFGRFAYTRTAATASAFDAEILFWGIAPLAFTVLLGALAGGFAGYSAGRWLPHARL